MAGEVFISYRRSDEPRARQLFELLKARGVEAWYDAHLGAGEDWRSATARALDAAPIFVLLFSQNASASDEIVKELAAATLKKKTIVPVRLEAIPLEGAFLYELASRNWIDAHENTDARLVELADKLAAQIGARTNAQLNQAALASAPAPLDSFRELLKRPWAIAASAVVLLVAAISVFTLSRPNSTPPVATTLAPDPVAQMAAKASFDDCRGEGWCPRMIVVGAGAFEMGSPDIERGRASDEGPQRHIMFAANFALGETEVTRAQYGAFVRETRRASEGGCYTINSSGGWGVSNEATWSNPGFAQGEHDPAVCVSWDDARAYLDWLTSRTGRPYRLPSESEWEYAARGGRVTAYVWGAEANAGCRFGNSADATMHARFPTLSVMGCNDHALYTQPVRSYSANVFGLYDVAGNVWEWVEDCYESTLDAVPANGAAHEECVSVNRVARGGAWVNDPTLMRVAYRNGGVRTFRSSAFGFRAARSIGR